MHRKKTAQATHEKHTIGAGGWQVQGQPGLQKATLSHKATKSNVLTELREGTSSTKLGQYTDNKKERPEKKRKSSWKLQEKFSRNSKEEEMKTNEVRSVKEAHDAGKFGEEKMCG